MTFAATTADAEKWVTSWAASVQGPYPIGNATAQPELRFAFRDPVAGATDQTFRLLIKPELFGRQVRLRFSNAYGTKPVTFDGVFAGLQMRGATIVTGTNRPVTFGGTTSVTVLPGGQVWTDPVMLPWVDKSNPLALVGRKLAVSFLVVGETGPMTWHAKGLQTSYVSKPSAGAVGGFEDESGFPYTTTSWYFIDALDAMAPTDTRLVVCFGDSITDGTNSSINADDRWPDVLAMRLQSSSRRVSVVNAGIGGNQVLGPNDYTPAKPYSGGPSALSRLKRDVLELSGVTHVIWMEGLNDLSSDGGASAEQVIRGYHDGVAMMRTILPDVRVIGATLTSVVGTTSAAHKHHTVEHGRMMVNNFIRYNNGLFDGIVDFDAATRDGVNGPLRPEYVPSSSVGGPGDGLHPNRAGYLAMAYAVDLQLLTGP